MMYLIDPAKAQYKANLHCHSVLSDGKKTPQELKEMYRAQGYSVLAITDHERPYDHSAMTEEDFLMITGYEAYIRPDGKYNRYGQEVHLNLFARQPQNETLICFDERYVKYLRRDHALEGLVCAGSSREREYTCEYINEFIRTAKENGYIVAHNHAYWSIESEAQILGYEGLFSMEMCNYSSYVTNHLEYNGALYDKLLTCGRRMACHGADDNHNALPQDDPASDSFGAFAMILSDSLTYDAVFGAMESGDMYASMGPKITCAWIDGLHVHVECSDAAHIFLFTGSKSPEHAHAMPGQSLNSADFDIDPQARYIRITVEDHQGRRADTRGFLRDELGLA